jgi:hypothetical protein
MCKEVAYTIIKLSRATIVVKLSIHDLKWHFIILNLPTVVEVAYRNSYSELPNAAIKLCTPILNLYRLIKLPIIA